MDRRAWWATVHSVTKSWTQLKQFSTHTYTHVQDLEESQEYWSLACGSKVGLALVLLEK